MASDYVQLPAVAAASWKSAVSSVGALPATNNTVNDARVAQDTSIVYVWSGSAWVADGGGGAGTVTSVALTAPSSILSVSGSPVTAAGTLALTLATQTANFVWAGPTSGGAVTPTFRALVAADIPGLAASKITSGQGSLTTSTTGVTAVGTNAGLVAMTIDVQTASGSQPGLISAADWTTFNNKQASGTYVTAVSVASTNGFTGSSSGGATPSLTLTTSITGVLKGNGVAISAATAGTDYSAGTSALGTGILKSTTTTGALTIAVAGDFPTLNQNTTGSSASCTGNAATVTTNANLTGPITSSGNATSIAAQTGTGNTFVMSASPTVSGTLTTTTQSQTGAYTNSFAGIASVPAMFFSGSPFTGGSGTTTRPAFLMEDAATPSSTWSTSGTYFGINALSTFSGMLLQISKAGTSEFSVDSSGAGIFRSTVQASQLTVGSSGVLSNANNTTLLLGSVRTFSNASTTQVQIANSTSSASSGVSVGTSITPTYNQTSTAGDTDLLINRTETAIGSGAHLFLDCQIATVSKFSIDRTGATLSAAAQTTLTGTVGTAICSQPDKGSSYKKVVVFLNNYTDTGTQTYTFPTAFTNTPYVYGLAGGVSGATATTTTIKFTTTTLTGFVFAEGY